MADDQENKVQEDVMAMNKSFGFETAEGEKVIEEKIEKVNEEPKPKPEPELEPKPEPDPETGDEPKEEETSPDDEGRIDKEEELPEEDERDKIIADLRKKLDEKEVKEPEPEPEPEPIVQPKFDTQQFIEEDEDLEDFIRDPGKLNEAFNKVYQRACTDTGKSVTEGVLRSIPDVVRASVEVIDKLNKMNDKFFTDNKDLKPFRKVVASVFEEIASDNPGKDMMEILGDVANESRKRLELHKQAVEPIDRKTPKLPSRKKRTGIPEEKPNTNPLLNELEEMNKTLRR